MAMTTLKDLFGQLETWFLALIVAVGLTLLLIVLKVLLGACLKAGLILKTYVFLAGFMQGQCSFM
jgi:hypothetical protein